MNHDIKSTTFTIAAVVLAIALLLTAFHSEALGQISSSSSKNATAAAKPSTTGSPKQGNLPNALPSITGSIPLSSTISGAISSKVKTTLSEAITTAQNSRFKLFSYIGFHSSTKRILGL